jgi:hypothetical protein
MRGSIRATAVGVAAVAALAFAGSAFASFTPQLLVKQTAGAPVTITVKVAPSDDPTARVVIYVPTGVALSPPALGSKLGDVVATASAADLGGAVLPLTGELDAISQSALTPSQQGAEQACIGAVSPAAIWDMHLAAAGQTLDIPMFIIQTSGVEQTAGVAKIVVCLPPPDVPTSNPNRAVFGAKLLSATFTTSALVAPASGTLRWTSLWTPYTPGAGTANAAGSVETQSIAKQTTAHLTVTRKRLVSYKTINHKKHKIVKTRVHWSATAAQDGAAVPTTAIVTTRSGAPIGGASGSFILLKGKATLTATATVPDQDLAAAGCVPTPLFQGLPCIDATVVGATAKATATVTAYKK